MKTSSDRQIIALSRSLNLMAMSEFWSKLRNSSLCACDVQSWPKMAQNDWREVCGIGLQYIRNFHIFWLLLLLLLLLYHWVYSSQGLKAKKKLQAKLEWLLAQNSFSHNSVIIIIIIIIIIIVSAVVKADTFLANVNSCSCSLYVVVRPSVCRLSVCNVRAPYSADWNFRQCFCAT